MTSRSTSLRFPEGTSVVGTARVREDRSIGRGFAERELMRRTGVRPNSEFDEIAGCAPTTPASVAASARASAETCGAANTDRMARRAHARKSKYRNTKCESGGYKFDSLSEMRRWQVLEQMQERGEISGLRLQVPFILAPAVVINGRTKPALKYVADFVYETRDARKVIEDVKGAITAVYSIKRHLMAVQGLTITEIK